MHHPCTNCRHCRTKAEMDWHPAGLTKGHGVPVHPLKQAAPHAKGHRLQTSQRCAITPPLREGTLAGAPRVRAQPKLRNPCMLNRWQHSCVGCSGWETLPSTVLSQEGEAALQ